MARRMRMPSMTVLGQRSYTPRALIAASLSMHPMMASGRVVRHPAVPDQYSRFLGLQQDGVGCGSAGSAVKKRRYRPCDCAGITPQEANRGCGRLLQGALFVAAPNP